MKDNFNQYELTSSTGPVADQPISEADLALTNRNEEEGDPKFQLVVSDKENNAGMDNRLQQQ
jgi:hypothetical protein